MFAATSAVLRKICWTIAVCLLLFFAIQVTQAQSLTVQCDSSAGPTSQNLIYSYTDTCRVTGGTAPYTWSLNSSSIPLGLQVNGQSANTSVVSSSITISGVVLQAGQYYYSWLVQDSGSPYPTYSYSPYFSATINPLLNALDPAAIGSGGPDITITATGAGFVNNQSSSQATVLSWSGTNLTTTFIDSKHVSAVVPSSLTASPTTAAVRANVGSNYSGSFYPSVMSSPFTFSVDTPAITSLNPSSATVNGSGFTLTVNGVFSQGATVLWNGAALTTTFVSPTQLTAAVPAGLMTTVGNVPITVVSGGTTTADMLFMVVPAMLTSLSPSTVSANGPAFLLTVNGSGFDSSARVFWGEMALATTFVSGTQLRAAVPASLITTIGTFAVSVSAGNAFTLTSLPVSVIAAPTLTSLLPTSATAGGSGFVLSVYGTGFDSSATVLWNGAALTTTFVGTTQLTATVPARLITTAGSVPVSVVSGGLAPSTTLNFTVAAGPTLAAVNPSAAIAGAAGLTMTLTGTGFAATSIVQWNGIVLASSYVTDTQLTAVVPASLLLTPGTASVIVVGGGVGSNSVSFAVLAPSLTTITPATVTAGSAAFALTVRGNGFTSNATVLLNGTPLTTTFINAFQLRAAVPASLIASPGTAQITISSGSVASGAVPLSIVAGPAITSLNPASAAAADPAFILTVSGTAFGYDSVVFWGSTALATSFVSSTQITARVPAGFFGTAGSVAVTVISSGVTSNPSTFTINPIPAAAVSLTGLQPTAMPTTNLAVGVQVAAASPYDMQGTLQLSFAPSVAGLPSGYMDPALQFASGGTTVNFTMAAGSTLASVPQQGVLQLGTVAGTVTVSVTSLTANGVSVLPGAAITGTVIVSPLPPVIVTDSIKMINVTDTGFTVQLTGYSTTREVSVADFELTAAPGAELLGSNKISVATGAAFQTWFDSAPSQTFGSQFVLQVPFTVAGNTSKIVQSVAVKLTNSAGTSAVASTSK